jgi:hypothetical protein
MEPARRWHGSAQRRAGREGRRGSGRWGDMVRREPGQVWPRQVVDLVSSNRCSGLAAKLNRPPALLTPLLCSSSLLYRLHPCLHPSIKVTDQ